MAEGRSGKRRPPPGLSSLSRETFTPERLYEEALFSTPSPPRTRNTSDPLASSDGPNSRPKYGHSSSPSFDWTPVAPTASSSRQVPEDEDGVHLPLLPLTSTTSRESIGKSKPLPLQSSTSGFEAYTYSDPFVPPSPGAQGSAFEIVFDVDEQGLSPGYLKAKGSHSNAAQCSPETPSPDSSTSFLRKPSTPYSPDYRGKTDTRFPRTSAYSTASRHPFGERFKLFEVPQWRKLAMHIGLCGLAYPFLLIFVLAARGKNLFWARLFTGAGCGMLGLLLGISLLKLARGIIEAATWATVIHQSRVSQGAGVRLKDLAAHSDDHESAMTALRLVWDRHQYPGADRKQREYYDSRPWSIWIVVFLANVALSGMLPFVLARLVDINVYVVHQFGQYDEIAVKGDLSAADLARADDLLPAFERDAFLTWTLAPFSVHGGLPPVVSFPWQNNSMIYFSEVVLSQLVTNGSGFGTFETAATTPTTNLTGAVGTQVSMSQLVQGELGLERGSLLRFPRWGLRIKCAKIPDLRNNIETMSESNITYLFTPRETLRPLFSYFDMPFPDVLEKPLNMTRVLQNNDTVSGDINISKTAMGGPFWNNGVAHSIRSSPLSMGKDGKGFVTIENILVRLNTSYAPHGAFPVLSKETLPDENGTATFIGYDAVVCLELYEPWVLDVYNSSVGLPASFRIVGKGPSVTDMNTQLVKERRKGKPLNRQDFDGPVSMGLNSTAMRNVYIVGHQNSVNHILKDNGRDAFYVPSPTLISFTDGQGPFGYTELSEAYYANSRALADAGNLLPYFAGSGWSFARRYYDKEVSSVTISLVNFAALIIVVILFGSFSAFFVPRLPLDMPRRGFDLYSWMTAFAAQELVPDRASQMGKQMELDEIMEHSGDLKFRYVG